MWRGNGRRDRPFGDDDASARDTRHSRVKVVHSLPSSHASRSRRWSFAAMDSVEIGLILWREGQGVIEIVQFGRVENIEECRILFC